MASSPTDSAGSTTTSSNDLMHKLCDRALLRGEFVLRSGKTSTYYFDKYRVTTAPELLREVGAGLASLLHMHAPDAELIVAPELGAVPLATALSLATGLPFCIVRGEAKDYGTANRLEGMFEPGQRAVLVEDVVTSGGAAVEALEAARAVGLVVDHSLCMLDRGQGGSTALADAGAPLAGLFDADDLAPFLG